MQAPPLGGKTSQRLNGFLVEDVGGRLLIKHVNGAFKYTSSLCDQPGWRWSKMISLAGGGRTQTSGTGYASAQEAAMAASEKPWYKAEVATLQERDQLTKQEPSGFLNSYAQGPWGQVSTTGLVGVSRDSRDGMYVARCNTCRGKGLPGNLGRFETANMAGVVLERHACIVQRAQEFAASAADMPKAFAIKAAAELGVKLTPKCAAPHGAEELDDYSGTVHDRGRDTRSRTRPWVARALVEGRSQRYIGSYHSSFEAALHAAYMTKYKTDLRALYTHSPDDDENTGRLLGLHVARHGPVATGAAAARGGAARGGAARGGAAPAVAARPVSAPVSAPRQRDSGHRTHTPPQPVHEQRQRQSVLLRDACAAAATARVPPAQVLPQPQQQAPRNALAVKPRAVMIDISGD